MGADLEVDIKLVGSTISTENLSLCNVSGSMVAVDTQTATRAVVTTNSNFHLNRDHSLYWINAGTGKSATTLVYQCIVLGLCGKFYNKWFMTGIVSSDN